MDYEVDTLQTKDIERFDRWSSSYVLDRSGFEVSHTQPLFRSFVQVLLARRTSLPTAA